MKYCASCGQRLSDDCDVCPICYHGAEDAITTQKDPYEAEKYVRSGVKYSYVKPRVTIALIAINVLVYLIITLLNLRGHDLTSVLSMHRGAVVSGQYYRVLTSMFTHEDLFHILSNCYALYVYGIMLEPAMGKWRYISVYFVSGLVGNLLTFAFMPNPSIGASGAIFGLLGSILAIYFINPTAMNRMMMKSVLSCVAITTIYSFAAGGINNIAHFGGLFGGYMMTCVCVSVRHRKRIITSKSLMAVALIITLAGSVFVGIPKTEDSAERQYGNWTVMRFLSSFDMYEEANVYAGKILEDEDSYYSGDAMAVYLINIIESGNEITEDDAERFEELIYDGYLLTEEKIYDDFKEYLKSFE